MCNANAQLDTNTDLFIELKKQDSIFFERSFNLCDMDYLAQHITQDLKFYHDRSGFQDRDAFFENTKKYICSGAAQKPIRKVDPGSLEVFPLYNQGVLYGAIQKGVHHFFLREKDKEDLWTSTAKFTSVWILENENWMVSEVLSYDHQDPEQGGALKGFEKLLKEHQVPALGMATIADGMLTKVEVYGTLDGERKAPYNTIFKVASLTKPIVALTALKLVDAGLLSLDEALYRHWIDPDLKNDKRHKRLTPRLILSHQSGFPNWRYLNESQALSFEFEPGTKFQYSGEGFEYLRQAIENKLGKSLEELADSLVLKPAKMHDTRFWWDEEMNEKRYALNFDKEGKPFETNKYYEANAAANLLTTLEDYGNFMAYVLNGAGLSNDLFEEMTANQVKLKEDDYFTLGWEKLTNFSTGDYALLHTGKDPGVSTLAIMYPKSRKGFVIFLNGDNVDKIYEKLALDYLYLGSELWDRR